MMNKDEPYIPAKYTHQAAIVGYALAMALFEKLRRWSDTRASGEGSAGVSAG